MPFLSTIFLITQLISQDLFPDLEPIYKDDLVPRVDITLPPDSLDLILAFGNEESDYHFHATFQFDNGVIKDTLPDVGFRLRGNTSRYSQKKSFKVSFNTYEQGRKWHGIEKLNLNGEHNDPSVSRSKICWDLLREIGVPASRANHVRLYINDEYFGLYANVEHIDEEFVKTRFGNNSGNLYKCLWPADMIYLGEDPDLYKMMNGDRRAYELITNVEQDDYRDLAELIDILNNTPISNLRCELEPILNIHTFLKAMVFDILTSNWDGPLFNKNNFYLYHNQKTGKFEYIPYDLDNTFGIDWFNIDWADRNIYSWGPSNELRPLYWRILEVPEYRDRFSYLMDQVIHRSFQEAVLFPKTEAIRNMIIPFVIGDPYYSRDYGFSQQDFNNSFSQPLPYNHTPYGIKDFISARRNAVMAQLQLRDIPAIISEVSNNLPNANQDIQIQARVEDDNAGLDVRACYRLNGIGDFACFTMFDDGMHADGTDNDNVYGVVIPAIGAAVDMEYEIRVFDNMGKLSIEPVCDTKVLSIKNVVIELAINEFMASNDSTITDDFDEFDDWLEIYNYGLTPIYLGDKYLTDKLDNPTKWAFPDQTIQPGEYMLFWADEDMDQGENHTNFKISASGEYLGIYDSDANSNSLIDGIEFGAQETDLSFGRIPNGTGAFQVLSPTPGASNEVASPVIDLNDKSLTYQIFPNPVRTVLHIESNQFLPDVNFIVLYNSMGQKVLKSKWSGAHLSLTLAQLQDGLYFLFLEEVSSVHSLGKVIKQ